MIPHPTRHYFKQIGISSCNETDVLRGLQDGIYSRKNFIASHSKNKNAPPVPPVAFNEEGLATIYSYESQLDWFKVNVAIPLTTAITSYLCFTDKRERVIQNQAIRYILWASTAAGWWHLFNRTYEKSRTIYRIDLVQHADNKRYASELVLYR